MTLPAGFLEAVAGVPIIVEGESLVRKSRDNFWYSPVLRRQFADVDDDLAGGIGQLLGVVWNGAHGRTSSNSRHYTVARQGLAWLPRPA